jgi:hypothetical protein
VLKFTTSGAVSSPETLQIRVTRGRGGVRAGAPEPARSLTDAEVLANLRHFTEGHRGPRTRPCTGLVLSGVSFADRPGLGAVVDAGRALGLQHVTVHVGGSARAGFASSPLAERADAVALTVTDPADVADVELLVESRGRGAGFFVSAVVPLDRPTLPRLPRIVDALAGARPDRVVLTWPMPSDEGAVDPPPAGDAAEAARAALRGLDAAGVPAGVKGLPHCSLGPDRDRAWRSQNRWYVDAEHQLDGALLFFPDVVRFSHADVCRFCARSRECDGAPERWLRLGLGGVFAPVVDD